MHFEFVDDAAHPGRGPYAAQKRPHFFAGRRPPQRHDAAPGLGGDGVRTAARGRNLLADARQELLVGGGGRGFAGNAAERGAHIVAAQQPAAVRAARRVEQVHGGRSGERP